MISAAVQRLLDALPDTKSAGSGKWAALCPVHEADGNGHRPSLSIGQGDDGCALLKCMAGCSTEDVVKALGLTMADLFADRPNTPHKPAKQTAKPARVFALPCLAAKALAKSTGGRLAGYWQYLRADGNEALTELRFSLPLPASAKEGDKPPKTCRPIHPDGDGWSIGDSPDRFLPPYNLTAARSAKRVYLVEGPRKVDEMTRLGLTAITSAYGAGAARKTDWRGVAGKEIVGLPDNDASGQGYVQEVGAITTALDPPARVRIVRLPGLAEGEDIMEYLEIMDAHTSEEIAENIEGLADTAPIWTPPAAPAESEIKHVEPVLICMQDVESRVVPWLWERRIPLGRPTLLVSRAGEGKTFLACADITSRVTTGTPWPDGSPCPKGSVILICGEDDPHDTLRPRLDAHRADCTKVHLLTMVRRVDEKGRSYEVMFTLQDVEALETALKMHPDCKLVVVDPIGSFVGGDCDTHRDNEVRSVLAPVARLAEIYGPAVLILAHRRKSSATNADDLALGSRAFTALCRAVWHISRDPDNKQRRFFLPGKNNLAPESGGLAFTIDGDPPTVIWERDLICLRADDALTRENEDARPGPEPKAHNAAIDWLQTLLATGPMPSGNLHDPAPDTIRALAKEADFRWATIRRAADTLGVRREKSSVTGLWQWRLPTSKNQLAQVGHLT